MKLLVTGGAGFIGYHLTKGLLDAGYRDIWVIDNLNDYYDPALKEARLADLRSRGGINFVRLDITERDELFALFAREGFDVVLHMAAQAGVRYSIENPGTYVESNVVGFFHILEACRAYPVRHLIYASSSSVYGMSEDQPFCEDQMVDAPESIYAATKKSNELFAYSYAKLYGIPTTGLRFFTVYGPYGRPDMAYYSFAEKIRGGQPIQVYNHGQMKRDFTYVDDVVAGILPLLDLPPGRVEDYYRILNIGNNKPECLGDFIAYLEGHLDKEAIIEYRDMQPGDVVETYADISRIHALTGFWPQTDLKTGLGIFVDWFMSYTPKETL
ncbi:MAG: NAD-dependent epimerase/dehydratase family protein [Oscillospiraceae bacterium]|nr:NAD-dependent epimerase/dehydratase family protein [Oscillospiraceae bacterium]